jgi:hexosaminidase
MMSASALCQDMVGLLPTPKTVLLGKPISTSRNLNVRNTVQGFRKIIDAFCSDWQIVHQPGAQDLVIRQDSSLEEEEYKISFDKYISVTVASKTGLAWALQTLGQVTSSEVRYSVIHDKPDVPYRCVTVDVARRYHSISTLKTISRWCQLGKVRYLQLHLTDDQNWMFPTKVFAGVDIKNQHHLPAYTRAELTDLQEFASSRGVTIVPEIDLPGHSSLLVAFNPSKFQIQGSASNSCINFGSADVRNKVKSLIGEVNSLFPNSPYIHFGGDEAWYPDAEKNTTFRATMNHLGRAASPADVFADFIADIAQEVIRLNKTPIVWEGFAPSEFAQIWIPKQTIVVAWEGTYYPAKNLLKDGYQVVNGGWDPYYVVNHFPYESYTLVPLERLYGSRFNKFGIVDWGNGGKVSVDLPSSNRLLGSMLCWWEGHEWNTLQVMPERITAFGSQLWNAKSENDFGSFRSRFEKASKKLLHRAHPIDCTAGQEMLGDGRLFEGPELNISFGRSGSDLSIGWRTDGKIPTKDDIHVGELPRFTNDGLLTVQAYSKSKPIGETEFIQIHRVKRVQNLAMGCPVTTSCESDPIFGAFKVTDGVADVLGSFWLAYPNPQTLTIDLGSPKVLNRLEVVAFWATGAPTKYRLALSLDNNQFSTIVDASKQTEPSTKEGYVHHISATKARFVRIETLGSSLFPSTMTRINEIRAFGE